MEIIEHVPCPGLADEEGISRRDLLTTAARLGTGLAIGAAALGTGTLGLTSAENALAAGTMLQLYNDKANWAPWINAAGQSALKAVGAGWKSVPYADTTTYQASIRTSARTSKAPDLFTWWSGWKGAWENNLGWRIDYQIATPGIASKAKRTDVFRDIKFSDHAPLTVDYDHEVGK